MLDCHKVHRSLSLSPLSNTNMIYIYIYHDHLSTSANTCNCTVDSWYTELYMRGYQTFFSGWLSAEKLKSRTTKRRKFSTSSTFRDRAENDGKHDNLWERWVVQCMSFCAKQSFYTHVLNVTKHRLSLICHSNNWILVKLLNFCVTTDTTSINIVTETRRLVFRTM